MIQNKIGEIKIQKETINKLYDREVKLSKYIPISNFLTYQIFSTKKGELGAVLKVEGVPFNVKVEDEINQLQFALSFAIQNLEHDYAIYVTTYRHLQPGRLTGEYPEGFIKDFAENYAEKFKSSKLYVNDIYITLIKKQNSVAANVSLINRFKIKKQIMHYKQSKAKEIKEFENDLLNFKSMLSAYSPKVLGADRADETSSEVLKFLSILVNGNEREYAYPRTNVAHALPEKRLFFGNNAIHFQGRFKKEDKFAAILSIRHYAPFTSPGMLNDLLTLPIEMITTHSFLTVEKDKALKLIEKQTLRLNASEDAALSQIEELEIAKDDLASGRIKYGFHHHTLTILTDELKTLDEKVAKVIKVYQDQRMTVVRETLNLESSFWSQIPGNFERIRRSAPISSHNFSCFCSLHNYYTGYVDRNHLGSALMQIETPSMTPLHFNLHEKSSGRKDDLSKAHTLLIGPSNAGKTALMNAIDAHFTKYNIRSFYFDRNQGCELYIRAVGGTYNRLIPGEATNWNPCQIKDTPKNRKFLRDFISVLSTSDVSKLSSEDYKEIHEVVERNFTLPFPQRNLSNISSFFSLNFSGLAAFSRYLRLEDRSGKSGDRSYLFDHSHDDFNLNSDRIGFDMTHWLSDAGSTPEELLPISMYIFNRLEETFDGRLTAIYLDEGWQFLEQPYWREKLEEYLVTLRKSNVFIFLSTQLPDKLAKSKASSALIQGTATQLFLGNYNAQEKDYIDHFKLSSKEHQLVKSFNLESRQFLIKQGHDAAVGVLNLKGLEKYLSILSANTKTVALCESIRNEVGDDPREWLPLFYDRVSM